MQVYFGGAEKGSYRNMLLSAGVQRYGVNLTHFPIPKRKELDLDAMFRGGDLLLYTSENDEDDARYDAFIRDHVDQLSVIIGRPNYDGAWLGDKYVPIWNDEGDLERLAWLCQKYGRAAVSDKAITAKNSQRINALAQRWGAKLIGLTSKPDLIERIGWDSVVVGSWTSSIRYGETQVWDGHGLRRYPAQQKESSRKRHRSDIQRLGIDVDAVMADDVEAVGLLSIRSWQEWENHTFGGYDPMIDDDENEMSSSDDPQILDIHPQPVTPTSAVSGGASLTIGVPNKRHESNRFLLPVMGVEQVTSMGTQSLDSQGESIEIDPEVVPVIKYNADPLRQCNTCYLSSRCPAFQEHMECAYKLPIEIRTKDQLQSALRALIEMQVGRVLFARFAEELEGQGLDPVLSAEMDRVFNLVEKFSNISDNRDMVRLQVEARGSAGVLSRIFGQRAGEVSRQLPGGGFDAHDTNMLMEGIIDAEEG